MKAKSLNWSDRDESGDLYFDELSPEIQSVVHDWLSQFESRGQGPESFECRARSGFIPHSWNRGGLSVQTFGELYDYMIGDPAHCIALDADVQKKVDARVESLLADAREAFCEKYGEDLSDLGVLNEDVNYHGLEAVSYELAREFEEYEREFLGHEYSSTWHEIRVMFNGIDKFTIDVMFEFSDAPYHRGVDQCKSFEVKTLDPKKLEAFLNSITKEVSDYYPG